MLAHHLCTAQGHRLLCWHDRGCNTPHVPCQRHDSSTPPQPFQQSPKPMAEPASCSRAAQPCHDHFEDMSQDTPNSAPSPKHHCVSSPSLWAPLAPAYFWSLFSNEVPKGDSGLGAGSAQLPAWGGCTSLLQHPQIPSDMHHGSHGSSHPLQEQRAWVMVRQQGQGFHKVGALWCDTSNTPPHFTDPHSSAGSHLSARL